MRGRLVATEDLTTWNRLDIIVQLVSEAPSRYRCPVPIHVSID